MEHKIVKQYNGGERNQVHCEICKRTWDEDDFDVPQCTGPLEPLKPELKQNGEPISSQRVTARDILNMLGE